MKKVDGIIKEKLKTEKELEKEKKEISNLLNIRAYQVAKIREKLEKPTGLFQKKCPQCGRKLWGGRLNSYYKYFLCINCYYDYSKPVEFSLLNSIKNFIHPCYSKEIMEISLKGKKVVNIKDLYQRIREVKRKNNNFINIGF